MRLHGPTIHRSAFIAFFFIVPAAGCFDPVGIINQFVFDYAGSDNCEALAPGYFADPDAIPEPLPTSPLDLGLDYESFSVPAATGNSIQGWFIPAAVEEPLGTVMMSNGSLGTRACHLAWTEWLARAGYHVVMYDYEGFGGSEGFKTMESIMRDARAALEWTLDSDDPARQAVALMGLSLGSGPSVRLAAEYPDDVWAVVLDSPYVVPAPSDLRSFGLLLDLILPEIVDAFPTELDNTANIRDVASPVLILQGALDVTFDLIGRLEQAAPNGLVKLVAFGGSRHAGALFDEPQRYREEVLNFLGAARPTPR